MNPYKNAGGAAALTEGTPGSAEEAAQLRHELAALRQLFEVYEQTALTQATKLERMIDEQRLLDLFLEHIPNQVYFKDRESRFMRVSHVQANHLGLNDPAEAIGKTDFDFFSAEHAKQALADEQQILRTGRPITWKEEMETWPDGRETWALTTKVPLRDARGEIIGTLGISHDITARKRAEQELREHKLHLEEVVAARTAELAHKAEELAQSNAELEQFAYVASHDLQEPLRMIASYTQLLARRYQGKLDADADEFIHFAVDGANRMQQLIRDLLAYSRLTTRGKAPQLTESREACERALENLRQAIEDTGAVIHVEALPAVLGDATQLAQLFQNLIGNALKYCKQKPEIHVGAGRKEDEWLFFVRDNGIGIEPEYFDRVFQMFQRLHTRNEYSGTGIGLAICRKIVERHGGKIWIESQPGRGSTFWFTIRQAERR
jgi:PAS domain S-box-containing protein